MSKWCRDDIRLLAKSIRSKLFIQVELKSLTFRGPIMFVAKTVAST